MADDNGKTVDTPRSHRDALIAEILGDVGILHDLIKAMPGELDKIVSTHETKMRGQSAALSSDLENRIRELRDLVGNLDSIKQVLIGEIASRATKKVREDTKFNVNLMKQSIVFGVTAGILAGAGIAVFVFLLLR